MDAISSANAPDHEHKLDTMRSLSRVASTLASSVLSDTTGTSGAFREAPAARHPQGLPDQRWCGWHMTPSGCRPVNHGLGGQTQASVTGILHHTDHLAVRPHYVQALAEWVSIGEELAGDTLADDRHRTLLQGILLVQRTTRKKRDSHGVEETRANAIDAEIVGCDTGATERQIRERGHRFDSRKCREALVQFPCSLAVCPPICLMTSRGPRRSPWAERRGQISLDECQRAGGD
jgi:hypothetical protein